MTKNSLCLPLDLSGLNTWTEVDNALAFAHIIPRLLYPTRAAKRGRVRNVFYLRLRRRIPKSAVGREGEVRSFLDSACRKRGFESHKTESIRTYLNRLRFGQEAGKVGRAVATTGLTVISLAQPDNERRNKTLSEAREKIFELFETGAAIAANRKTTRKYWFKWKSVAHICAAFVDFYNEPGVRAIQIDRKALRLLEADMVKLVERALFYQDFLLGNQIIGGRLSKKTLNAMELVKLPAIAAARPSEAIPKFPTWDRKKTRDGGATRTPNRAKG